MSTLNSSPTILVTGSSGHLGTALVLSLPEYGYVPLGMDILASTTTTIVGSITSRDLIRRVLHDHPNIEYILHTATLHKPHIESHSKQDFIETNILGTLILLEEAARTAGRIKSFIFTSTTSTFGGALTSGIGCANWIDESVAPVPKNIYGVTKISAEDICELVQRQTRDKMSVIILRTSRFFPEGDDVEQRRIDWPDDDNLKVNELTYRRADIADIVNAHVCAIQKSDVIRWGKYIISAPPPFSNDKETLQRLSEDPSSVLKEIYPQFMQVFEKKGWKFLDELDRVYDSSKAVRELGWRPVYTFERAINQLLKGEEWRSDLWLQVGKKGYHEVSTGVYTIR